MIQIALTSTLDQINLIIQVSRVNYNSELISNPLNYEQPLILRGLPPHKFVAFDSHQLKLIYLHNLTILLQGQFLGDALEQEQAYQRFPG